MKFRKSFCWTPRFHCVDLRRLEVERGRAQREGRIRVPARRREVLQPAPLERRAQHARRVGNHVEHHVALRPVVEDPPAAAEDGFGLAGEIVDESEAGRDLEAAAVLQLFVDALAGLERAVEPVRAGRQPADEPRVHGVGERRHDAGADERRVHPPPVGARARRGADAHRPEELRGCARVELIGQEVRRLEGRVPLRRHVVEADPVVERQPGLGLPVVLHVELIVLVAPLRERVLRGLRVGVEHPGRRVRVAVARVERVVRVVGEVDVAVERREDALRLEAVLVVEPGFRGVGPPDLGQVRDHVVRDVLVGERAAIGLVLAGVACASAAEPEKRGRSPPERRRGTGTAARKSLPPIGAAYPAEDRSSASCAARPQLSSSDVVLFKMPVVESM